MRTGLFEQIELSGQGRTPAAQARSGGQPRAASLKIHDIARQEAANQGWEKVDQTVDCLARPARMSSWEAPESSEFATIESLRQKD
jgi:hypothetical protein